MYPTLREVIQATSATVLINNGLDKIYSYTNSNFEMNCDYIYIPMPFSNENLFNDIEYHLNNPNCKGFFISKKDTSDKCFLDILKKYSPENVLVVRNRYNSAFETASLIANKKELNIVILAGTDENKRLREELSYNLQIENLEYENFWQKALDAILRIKDNQKFAIVETNSRKPCAQYIRKIKDDAVIIFTKITFANISTYNSKDDFIAQWYECIPKKAGKIIFSKDTGIIEPFEVENLVVCEDVIKEYLNMFNIERKTLPERTKNKITYNDTNSYTAIKKSIREFITSDKDKRKVIIISKINTVDDNIYREIIEEIKEDIFLTVFIDLGQYTHYLRKNNKRTLIKRFNKLNENELSDLKKYLQFYKENTVYLIIGEDRRLCSIL